MGYHCYVEAGLPQTPVLLWVYGEQLRAIFEHVVLAAYACRYDWQTRKVADIREGVWYATRFASPQQALIPLTPQDCLVIYHPPLPRGRIPSSWRRLLYGFVMALQLDDIIDHESVARKLPPRICPKKRHFAPSLC